MDALALMEGNSDREIAQALTRRPAHGQALALGGAKRGSAVRGAEARRGDRRYTVAARRRASGGRSPRGGAPAGDRSAAPERRPGVEPGSGGYRERIVALKNVRIYA